MATPNILCRCILVLLLVYLSIAQNDYSLPENLNIPNLDDEIVIIGGGPSGVDMAVRLKNLGYSNILILEKNEEVGGKSKTIMLDGVAYDMGTVFLLNRPAYIDIVELLQKYGLDSRMPFADVDYYDAAISCAQTQFAQGCEDFALNISQVIIGSAVVEKPELVLGVAENEIASTVVAQVIQNMRKYNEIHRQIFGEYTTRLTPRPSNYSLIDKTAEEFLQENDLVLFKNTLKSFQTSQGYGYLDELPAYYLLHWMNPTVIDMIIGRLTGQINVSNPDEYNSFLRNGFQPLWKKMVEVEDLNVVNCFEVTKIRRSKISGVFISGRQNGRPRIIKADYIFIAAPQNRVLPLLKDASSEEINLFAGVTTSVFTTTLLSGLGFSGDMSNSFAYDNANQGGEVDQKLWWAMYKQGWITDPFNPLDTDKRTIVAYQYNYDRGIDYTDIALDTILSGGLDEVSRGFPVVEEIHEQIVWKDYFPRYSLEGLRNGGHWKILEIQGQQNTIYLGSLPSGFDSVEDVVAYTCRVVLHMQTQIL